MAGELVSISRSGKASLRRGTFERRPEGGEHLKDLWEVFSAEETAGAKAPKQV